MSKTVLEKLIKVINNVTKNEFYSVGIRIVSIDKIIILENSIYNYQTRKLTLHISCLRNVRK